MSTKINWFEIPSSDFARAVKFYEQVFDTKLKVEMCSDSQVGVFTQAGGESFGCVIHGDQYLPGRDGTLIYFDAGRSIDRVLERIETAGGRVSMPKTALPADMGFIAHFSDTEGNRVAVHGMA